MKIIRVEDDPALVAMVDVQREMSRAQTSRQSLGAFMRRFAEFSPVRYAVDIRVGGLPPGSYHVLERGSIAQRTATRAQQRTIRPFRDAADDFEPSRGGFIATLIDDPLPKLVHHLDLPHDPVLGDELEPYGSCAATPVFEDGQVVEWIISFFEGPEEASVEQLQRSVPNANLLRRTAKQMDLIGQVQALNARLARQLEQVASVQRSLLPPSNPSIPDTRIASSYLTSDEAGGDYYDFFALSEHHAGILIADVSGHGAAAATVMAMLHAILHGFDPPDFDPAAVLAYANNRLNRSTLDATFVTAFLAVYDARTGELTYARAGHNPPRIYRPASDTIDSLDRVGEPPLGVLDTISPEVETVTIEPTDALILYTDGITEAFSPAREMFGTRRFDDAIRAAAGDPDRTIESVHADLYRHTRSRRRADDQTLVVMQRTLGPS
ncbi:MAG: PP2C family protein-serine/threonine phosphatase [Phycisphaerales bacterium JB037]